MLRRREVGCLERRRLSISLEKNAISLLNEEECTAPVRNGKRISTSVQVSQVQLLCSEKAAWYWGPCKRPLNYDAVVPVISLFGGCLDLFWTVLIRSCRPIPSAFPAPERILLGSERSRGSCKLRLHHAFCCLWMATYPASSPEIVTSVRPPLLFRMGKSFLWLERGQLKVGWMSVSTSRLICSANSSSSARPLLQLQGCPQLPLVCIKTRGQVTRP